MNPSIQKVGALSLCAILCGLAYQMGVLHGKRSMETPVHGLATESSTNAVRPTAPSSGLALHQAALRAASAPVPPPSAPAADTNPPSVTIPKFALKSLREFTQQEGKTYAAFLGSIGASEDTIAHVVKGLEEIHLASTLTEIAVVNLSQARLDYDRRIQQELGPERYAQYREYEKDKPFRVGADHITEFLTERGFSGEIDRTLLTQTLKEANFSQELSYGPYDGVPHPSASISDAVPMYIQQKQQVEDALSRLPGIMASRFPPEVTQQVTGYFQTRLSQIQDGLRNANLTPEERKQELIRKMAELEKAMPHP